MADTVKYRFVLRRGFAADWTAKNEILLQGEFGLELDDLGTDNPKLKIGDGSTAWNDLDYFASGEGGDRFAIAGGTSDALTATFASPVTALTDGLQFKVRAAAANATTAPTLKVDANAAYAITKKGGSALVAGDIAAAGHELLLRYNLADTRFELLNPASGVQSIVPGGGIAVDTSVPSAPVISSTLASIALSGRVATYADLPTTLGAGDAGKAYLCEADGLVYVWDGSAWPVNGSGYAGGSLPNISTYANVPAVPPFNGTTYKCTDIPLEMIGKGGSWVYFHQNNQIFTTSVLSTWVNQGTATLLRNGPFCSLAAPPTSGDSARMLVKPLAKQSGYSATAKISFLPAGVNYNSAGIVLRDSSSGRLTVLTIGSNGSVNSSSNGYDLVAGKLNSPTSYNGNYILLPIISSDFLWLRFKDDGTYRYYDYSHDGFTWYTIYQTSRTDFVTPDQVGIYVNTSNASYQTIVTALSFAES